MEERQDGNDAESRKKEIELLKQESMLPLDELLSTLTLPQVLHTYVTLITHYTLLVRLHSWIKPLNVFMLNRTAGHSVRG